MVDGGNLDFVFIFYCYKSRVSDVITILLVNFLMLNEEYKSNHVLLILY